MNSKTKYLNFVTTAIMLMSIILSAIQPTTVSAQNNNDDGVIRDYNADTGKVTMVTGANNEPITILSAMSTDMTDDQRADALVQSFAPEFGITNPSADLQIMEQSQPSENRVTTRYQQTYNGVPVMAGELIVNASEQGALYSMNGEIAQALSLDTTPTLTKEQAVDIAEQGMVKWYQGQSTDYVPSKDAELWVFDESLLKKSIRPAELVWRLEMVSADQSLALRELVLVDAKTGNISLHFNQIDTAWNEINPQQDEPTATPTPTEIPATEPPAASATPMPIETSEPNSFQPTPTLQTPPTEESSDLGAQGVYYVDIINGNDSNACTTGAAPCKHIQETINKAGTGSTIYVASGTYIKSTNPNPNVLQINNSVTLSGGWNATFTDQNGASIIDGANTNNGILAVAGTITVEHFIIQNSISNDSGGIYIVGGNFTLNNSTLRNNTALIKGGGIYIGAGTLSITNSTISGNGNSNTDFGGGIYANSGTVNITNSTIAYNTASDGGGINGNTGYSYIIKNTIIANNSAMASNPDCSGTISTISYSIIEYPTGCSFTPSINILNVDPQINSSLTGTMQVHTLLANSPAINAGTSTGCPLTDEEGISRPQEGICDIGASEYRIPGIPTTIEVYSGSQQNIQVSTGVDNPLSAMVKDQYGIPMSGQTVTFTAPASGPSGIFSDTGNNTTTAVTNSNGIANASAFNANNLTGSYVVEATVSGVATSAQFQLQNYIPIPETIAVSLGSPQAAFINTTFATPLSVLIKDQFARPVSGLTVTFTAPASGASGIFTNTSSNITQATTNVNGVATSASFTANNAAGNYIVNANVNGITSPAIFQLTNNPPTPSMIKYEDMVIDEIRGKIYGSDKAGNKIDVIDINTMTVSNSFILINGAQPMGLDLSPNGNELAIAQHGLNKVKFIDLTNNTTSEMPAALSGTTAQYNGTNPSDVVYGRPGVLYVLSDNGLHVINTNIIPHSEDSSQYITDIQYITDGDKFGAISSDKNTLYYIRGAFTSGDSKLTKYDVSSSLSKPSLLKYTYLYETGGRNNLRLSLIDDNNLLVSTGVVYNTADLTLKAKNFQTLSPVIALPGKSFYVTVFDNTSGVDTLFFHDKESSYKVSSLTTGKTGTPGAIAVTSDGNILFVSSTGGLAKFNIGSTPLGTAIDLPGSLHQYNDLAVDTARQSIYGTDPSGRIDVIDIDTKTITKSFLLPSGANPKGIDLSPDGNELAIALNGLEKIIFLNPETGQKIAETTPQLLNDTYYTNLPFDVIYGRTGRLYSDGNPGSGGIDYLHSIDTTTHTWIAKSTTSIRTGAELVISPDNKYIYATESFSSDTIYKFDIQSDTITVAATKRNTVGSKVAISQDGNKLYLNGGTVFDNTLITTLGTLSGAPGKLIEFVSGTPNFIALTVNGANGDVVKFVDPISLQVFSIYTPPTAGIINDMKATPDGKKIILNINSGISIVNTDTSIPQFIKVEGGNNQTAHLQTQFAQPFKVKIENFLHQPVPGITVTFTAPATSASGVFIDTNTNTTTAITDINGVATSSNFMANNTNGGYIVKATILSLPESADFSITNGTGIYTYTANNGTTLPGQLLCSLANPTCTNGSNTHADKSQQFSIGTYNLYLNQHGRNSIDNNGMAIVSSVHYDFGYNNAYWNGSQMVYGDAQQYPMADDIVAHELTHGVTQFESNLFYFYQSGAINESLSDIWGEYYDQTNGIGHDVGKQWLIGEDLNLAGSGAIRSMNNPPQFDDPDKMTSTLYITTDEDSGGVHSNSGVNNKAVSLMVEGGTFNGATITGIGWDKTTAIYYEAQTNLLSSGSDYSDLYYAVQQACLTLSNAAFKGINNLDCVQVKKALDAVQMNSQPVTKFNLDAPVCPSGVNTNSALNLFSDDFENGTSKWNISENWILADFYSTSPIHMMYGDDYTSSSTSTLEMANAVTLPVGTSYLYFKHAYGFEYDETAYYDGGVLEYSTDNGTTWKDAKALFSDGKSYSGIIEKSSGSSNTLQGRSGFVGDSHGYVSSRYNLTSLAGKNVKFRWVFSTDQFYYYFGWAIDDIKIYTCQGMPVIPAYTAPGANALITDYAPLLNWADVVSTNGYYQIQIATDNTFVSPLYDVNNLSTSQYIIPTSLNPDTTYYWRVRAFNALDETKGWTVTRSFRTALQSPVLTPITSPTLNNRPVFDWSDVVNTTNYTLQVSTVNTFASFVLNTTVNGSTYIPTVDLPANKTLYWRVNSNGTNGPSEWSATSSFSTANPPTIPTLSAPADKFLTTDLTPKLDWTNSTTPLFALFGHYDLQIATDASFSTIVPDIPNITNSEYTPALDLSPNTTYYWRVRSVESGGGYSAWSLVRSFRTALSAPTITPLTFPLENNRPTFDWNDVPGATGYTIQISTVSTFTSFVVKVPVVSSTFTPAADLPAKKTLFWRVIANGVNGPSLPSIPSNFSTLNPPSIPVLSTPADNLLITTETLLPPKLDWNNSTVPAGVTFGGYQLQVATDAAFSSIVPGLDVNGLSTSEFTITTPLTQNTKYYWRVRSYDNANHYSSWSLTRSFRMALPAPEILSLPASGAALQLNRPTFDWSDIPGATGYTIQVSTVNTFKSFVLNTSTLDSTFIPTIDLPSNKTLFWRVIATGVNGPSLPSTPSNFSTLNPPSIPVLSAPVDNLLITTETLLPPKLDWNNSTVPAGVTFGGYQLQVATDAAFSSIVPGLDVNGLSTSEFTITTPLTQNTKYYWRVRSYDNANHYSSWSLTRSFRMALPAPIPASPTGDTLTNLPTFNWSDVSGATGYTIQISTVNTFASFVLKTSVVNSTFTPTVALPANKSFYWRVIANGINGPSVPSSSHSFTTSNPPSTPVLSAPADNLLITNPLLPKLDWANSKPAVGTTFDHYELQVATDASFSSVILNQNINGVASSEFTLTTSLSQNTKYYWHVRSVNSLGQFSGWSLTRSFRIIMPAPTLATPTGVLPASNLKPVFDWDDVAGASYYSIQISTSSTFTSTLMNTTSATSTFTPITNLPANTALYWRVQAQGANGPSSWSSSNSFTLQ